MSFSKQREGISFFVTSIVLCVCVVGGGGRGRIRIIMIENIVLFCTCDITSLNKYVQVLIVWHFIEHSYAFWCEERNHFCFPSFAFTISYKPCSFLWSDNEEKNLHLCFISIKDRRQPISFVVE